MVLWFVVKIFEIVPESDNFVPFLTLRNCGLMFYLCGTTLNRFFMRISYYHYFATVRFIQFLLQKGSLAAFDAHVRKDRGESLTRYLRNTEPAFFISVAFRFDKTPEGFQYWNYLSDEWNSILSNITI